MNNIEKFVKDFIESLEEVEDEEVRTLLVIVFLSRCGVNEEEIIKWFNDLKVEKGVLK